jgi:hypothetical protein
MGNKWTEEHEIIALESNPLRYVDFSNGSVELLPSLGETVEIQRRTWHKKVKHLRFDTRQEGEALTIPLLPNWRSYPQDIAPKTYCPEILIPHTQSILELVRHDTARQVLEIIHGRYWGNSITDTISHMIESETGLQIEQHRSLGRKRIYNECLLIRNPNIAIPEDESLLQRIRKWCKI